MTSDNAQTRHAEAIPASTGTTLKLLRDAALLDIFYLAGGTGLALHFGHRLSLDLDFFATGPFDEEGLIQRVQQLRGFSLVAKALQTLHATVEETKVSFLGYAYPVLFPPSRFLEVEVADPRDIACMKVSAIAGRGTKRDFVDLYVSAREFGIGEILHLFERKYSQAHYSKPHILKSLVFFADAEKDPMPHMLSPLDWEDVKRFFVMEVPRIL